MFLSLFRLHSQKKIIPIQLFLLMTVLIFYLYLRRGFWISVWFFFFVSSVNTYLRHSYLGNVLRRVLLVNFERHCLSYYPNVHQPIWELLTLRTLFHPNFTVGQGRKVPLKMELDKLQIVFPIYSTVLCQKWQKHSQIFMLI